MAPESRVPRLHLAVVAAIVAASAVWFVVWRLTGIGPAGYGYLAVPAGAAVASHAMFRLIRAVPMDPVARRFWRLMAVAFALVTAGFSILAWASFTGPQELPTMPMVAAALVVSAFLMAMWAVGRVPVGITNRSERWKQWLDRTIAFFGCGTVLFTFGIAPMFESPDPWSPQALTMVGLSTVMAVGGITKVSYLGRGPVDRVALRLVAMTGLVGAGVAFLAADGYAGIMPGQSVVMPLAPLMAAAAVRRQWTATGARPRRANTWLPYLAIAAVDLPLVLLPDQLDWSGRAAIAAAVLVTALVAVRQYVAIRENARLLREKRASEERLRHEVTHDGLTGLANRGLFRERLAAALDRGEATVLLVDLDDFKTVNDSLGHEIGDHLLIAVAGSMRTAVGAEGLPVRLGGDEFAVLIDHCQNGAVDGEEIAERVLAEFAGPMSAHQLLVHASIGVATAPAGTALDHLLREADVAMYAAKQRGKANWVRYHDGMEQPVFAHARIGGELRRALDADEFRVYYQPIMDLARGRVIGVEALVRWQHPTRGLVSPAEFIPAAEGTGLIVPLGRFVLRESCRQAAAWLAEFGPDALQKVAPNVSVRQLHDPDFRTDVRAALADAGLSADRVVLELTESAVLRGPQVLQTLHELHGMGIRLALDDFGTGESSLSLLRAFPASIVKLDKSFVDGIELDEEGTPEAAARQAVARAVIQMARALDLDTVAEGIENQEQADRLLGLGYTLGQGFHLARPMPAGDLTRLLAEQRDRDLAVAA
ncbi:putative bifunctional diguanylate cyclase/phosphodiesterase [Paractinoplanes rishiriensis]|uniref:putative bifunctional diguanylate cyclase/phosphodiesterase n=1 Tax=Paractinoplanes rishiriensis TaxID=1050105 RepID=UPI001EF3A51F|nr:EAL domain-containing protein [Actinoplanes rishiriensis]